MLKNLVVALFCITSLLAQDNLKYQDESKFNNFDPRIFVGLEGAYNYTSSSEDIDKTVYSYSFYIGTPILSKYELIIKDKYFIANGYDMNSQSLTINFPFDGTSTRESYFGIIGGVSEMEFESAVNYNLVKKVNDGKFYGVHIGARNKYTRNVFVRYELEYLNYDLQSKKNDNTTLDLEASLEFLVGVEYRF
jgi:hypothetical protein